MERRTEDRARKVFRAAYVRTGGVVNFATLRNVSDSGACFSGLASINVGDLVSYCYDGHDTIDGVVRWTAEDRFGVENLTLLNTSMNRRAQFPYRSVRLPITFPARVFIVERVYETTLFNLSISGACISDPGGLSQGNLVSIEIADQTFSASTVKWVNNERAGLRFSTRLSHFEIRSLSSKLQELPGRILERRQA